jgi:hypothetical protein
MPESVRRSVGAVAVGGCCRNERAYPTSVGVAHRPGLGLSQRSLQPCFFTGFEGARAQWSGLDDDVRALKIGRWSQRSCSSAPKSSRAMLSSDRLSMISAFFSATTI